MLVHKDVYFEYASSDIFDAGCAQCAIKQDNHTRLMNIWSVVLIIKRDFNYINGASRPLHIYLPTNYFDTDKSYPVMYFFDGHNLFSDAEATYGKSWGLKSFLDRWPKKLIIVGIECGHEKDERLSEYLPYPVNKDSWLFGHKPEGAATMEWIIEDVKPFIDKKFKTMPFRECTAIGGSSMGGIMSLFALVRYNRYLSKAACLSSSINPCLTELLKDIDSLALSPDTRAYLSWGSEEACGLLDRQHEDTSSVTFEDNKKVCEALTRKDVICRMYCQVGGGHSETSWEKLVPDFMNFLWLE